MNDKLEQFFNKLKKTKLRPDEKAALRERILARSRGMVPTYKETERGTFWSVVFSHKILVSVPMAVLVMFGVSYGAERALPGEILYQVKVGLNEPVLNMLYFSEASRAGFEADIAQRRLTEAVTLLEGNNLDEKTKDVLLESALRRVDNFVAKTEGMNIGKKISVEESVPPAADSSSPSITASDSGGPMLMMMAAPEPEEYEGERSVEENFGGEDAGLSAMMASETDSALEVPEVSALAEVGKNEKDDIRNALNKAGENLRKAKSAMLSGSRSRAEEARNEAIRDAGEVKAIIEDLRNRVIRGSRE